MQHFAFPCDDVMYRPMAQSGNCFPINYKHCIQMFLLGFQTFTHYPLQIMPSSAFHPPGRVVITPRVEKK